MKLYEIIDKEESMPWCMAYTNGMSQFVRRSGRISHARICGDTKGTRTEIESAVRAMVSMHISWKHLLSEGISNLGDLSANDAAQLLIDYNAVRPVGCSECPLRDNCPSMNKITFEVYEDNGGFLRLYIMAGNKPFRMMSGWENMPSGELGDAIGELQADLSCIDRFDWDDLEWDQLDAAYRSDTIQGTNAPDLIADQDGIYPERMGIAGDLAMHHFWYAVEMDEDDNDWSVGSHDFDEAVEMAHELRAKFVATIAQGVDPVCIRVQEV